MLRRQGQYYTHTGNRTQNLTLTYLLPYRLCHWGTLGDPTLAILLIASLLCATLAASRRGEELRMQSIMLSLGQLVAVAVQFGASFVKVASII